MIYIYIYIYIIMYDISGKFAPLRKAALYIYRRIYHRGILFSRYAPATHSTHFTRVRREREGRRGPIWRSRWMNGKLKDRTFWRMSYASNARRLPRTLAIADVRFRFDTREKCSSRITVATPAPVR